MKRPGFIVIWPQNLDASRSRGKGRKIAASRALRQPSVKEIIQAATILGLSPQSSDLAGLPALHWEKLGYVAVKRSGSKASSLKAVSSEIAKARQRQTQVPVEPKKR